MVFRARGVDQDEFQRDRFRVMVRISNRDLNSAAAIQIKHVAEMVVCFHRERPPVRGANIQ